MQKKTLTPGDVSEMYRIPVGSLANMRCKKIGPRYYKVGRRVRYFVEDIERWVKSEPVLTRDCIEEIRQ